MSDVSIDKKLIKSIFHSMTGRYLVYAMQLISMMVLARVFSPETFGVFAVIQVFSVFFALVSEMGFGPALVHEPTISKKMRDGIYSFTWILGICVSLLFYIASPLIAWFYENPLYHLIVIPVAISIIFNTAIIVPLAAFNREKKFISIARFESIAELVSIAVVLISLKFLDPIWALSIKPLIVSLVKYMLILYGSKNTQIGMPKFGSEIRHINKIFGFSKYQGGFNFLNYFSRNLDNILVGKYLGTISLGVYDKAYQLMRYPLLLLTFAMSPAIQPVMQELKNNTVEFERLHNKFTFYMSLIGFFVGFFVCALSDFIVLIILGDQWVEVVPLIQILSISIPIQIVMSSSGGFYQAAGRTDLLLTCGGFSFCINVIAISLGIYSSDLIVLCWFLILAFAISFIQCYWVMFTKLMSSNYLSYFRLLLITLSSSLCIFIYLYFSK
jgi:O-antigen/teichoic acid export membrane protein